MRLKKLPKKESFTELTLQSNSIKGEKSGEYMAHNKQAR
jgi:hypothetical protein